MHAIKIGGDLEGKRILDSAQKLQRTFGKLANFVKEFAFNVRQTDFWYTFKSLRVVSFNFFFFYLF